MPRIYPAPKRPRHDARHVYRVYDRVTSVLLYVGSTNNPERRQLEHHHSRRYRLEDVRYEVEPAMSFVDALAEERRQVEELHPLDNERLRRPRPGVCGTASGYRQHIRRGEPTDPACRAAWQQAMAEAKSRRAS